MRYLEFFIAVVVCVAVTCALSFVTCGGSFIALWIFFFDLFWVFSFCHCLSCTVFSTIFKSAPPSTKDFVASKLPHIAEICKGLFYCVVVKLINIPFSSSILIISSLTDTASKWNALSLLALRILQSDRFVCGNRKSIIWYGIYSASVACHHIYILVWFETACPSIKVFFAFR